MKNYLKPIFMALLLAWGAGGERAWGQCSVTPTGEQAITPTTTWQQVILTEDEDKPCIEFTAALGTVYIFSMNAGQAGGESNASAITMTVLSGTSGSTVSTSNKWVSFMNEATSKILIWSPTTAGVYRVVVTATASCGNLDNTTTANRPKIGYVGIPVGTSAATVANFAIWMGGSSTSLTDWDEGDNWASSHPDGPSTYPSISLSPTSGFSGTAADNSLTLESNELSSSLDVHIPGKHATLTNNPTSSDVKVLTTISCPSTGGVVLGTQYGPNMRNLTVYSGATLTYNIGNSVTSPCGNSTVSLQGRREFYIRGNLEVKSGGIMLNNGNKYFAFLGGTSGAPNTISGVGSGTAFTGYEGFQIGVTDISAYVRPSISLTGIEELLVFNGTFATGTVGGLGATGLDHTFTYLFQKDNLVFDGTTGGILTLTGKTFTTGVDGKSSYDGTDYFSHLFTNATFNEGTGTVHFNPINTTTTQTIPSGITFHNLKITAKSTIASGLITLGTTANVSPAIGANTGVTVTNNLTIDATTAGAVVQMVDNVNANTNGSGITTIGGGTSAASGILKLNGKTLTINNSSGAALAVGTAGGSATNHIQEKGVTDTAGDSKITWAVYTNTSAHVFPFGTASGYIPFSFTNPGGSDAGAVTVSTYDSGVSRTVPTGGVSGVTLTRNGVNNTAKVVRRYWHVAAAGTVNATVVAKFNSSEDLTSPAATYNLQRWNNTSKIWEAPAGTQTTPSTRTIQAVGVTAFSWWTAADASSLLPIELKSFNAFMEDRSKEVKVEWETAAEYDNRYFEVQKSADGKNFQVHEKVYSSASEGKGDNYSSTDASPFASNTFYRLRQVDKSGTATFSKVVSVAGASATDALSFYANHSPEGLKLFFNNNLKNLGLMEITVANALGQVLVKERTDKLSENAFLLQSPAFDKPGMYIIKVSDGKRVSAQKVFVE